MEYTVDESIEFYGVVKNLKYLLKLLKTIETKNILSVYLHEEGIILSTEAQRSVKAMLYLKNHLFHLIKHKNEAAIPTFGISMDALKKVLRLLLPTAETITMLDTNDYCEIMYDGTGSYFTFRRRFKEPGSRKFKTMKCDLIPFEPEEESTELQLEESTAEEPQRLIMKSFWFKDLMNNLSKGYDTITFTLSPSRPPFRVIAEGNELLTEANCPKIAERSINFTCSRELTFSYLYAHISQCKKAMDLSSEISLEIFNSGALRMFFKIDGPRDKSDTVQFNFLPSTNFT